MSTRDFGDSITGSGDYSQRKIRRRTKDLGPKANAVLDNAYTAGRMVLNDSTFQIALRSDPVHWVLGSIIFTIGMVLAVISAFTHSYAMLGTGIGVMIFGTIAYMMVVALLIAVVPNPERKAAEATEELAAPDEWTQATKAVNGVLAKCGSEDAHGYFDHRLRELYPLALGIAETEAIARSVGMEVPESEMAPERNKALELTVGIATDAYRLVMGHGTPPTASAVQAALPASVLNEWQPMGGKLADQPLTDEKNLR